MNFRILGYGLKIWIITVFLGSVLTSIAFNIATGSSEISAGDLPSYLVREIFAITILQLIFSFFLFPVFLLTVILCLIYLNDTIQMKGIFSLVGIALIIIPTYFLFGSDLRAIIPTILGDCAALLVAIWCMSMKLIVSD